MSVASSNVTAQTQEFEAAVRLYRPKVFRFIFASLREQDAAETLTQDCFLKAFKAWSGFRNDCSLDTWLMQIAVNLVRDYARNRKLQFWRRTQKASTPAEEWGTALASREPSSEDSVIARQQVAEVWQAASSLPERQRTVFLLRFVEEMELLEIASATGMKEGTVKTHLFRALQAVRQRVGSRS